MSIWQKMNNTADFLKRTADKLGFRRDFYVEKNTPTVLSNIVVVPFYADIRSTFILSAFLLNQYKRKNPRQYMIVCSWPGWGKMFPYADEFWSLTDRGQAKMLASEASHMANSSETNTTLSRNILQHFENVMLYGDLQKYYLDGFQSKYMEEFGGIRRFLPEVPASNILGQFETELSSREGKKLVIFPTKKIRSWQQGRCRYLDVSRDFWTYTVERVLTEGYVPVLYQNPFTFDMSPDFTNRCLYLTQDDISHVLTAFREIGCVLDIHSGISRLAIAARCPFSSLDERVRYINQKDYEIDDICCEFIPKKYAFSLGGMLLSGTSEEWDASFMDSFFSRTNSLIGTLEKDKWMSTAEIDDEISPEKIRNRVSKRLGVKFIHGGVKPLGTVVGN